jgi:hypothetical protein
MSRRGPRARRRTCSPEPWEARGRTGPSSVREHARAAWRARRRRRSPRQRPRTTGAEERTVTPPPRWSACRWRPRQTWRSPAPTIRGDTRGRRRPARRGGERRRCGSRASPPTSSRHGASKLSSPTRRPLARSVACRERGRER